MILLRLTSLTLLDLTHVDIYLPCSAPKKSFPWEEVIAAKNLKNLILVGAFQALPLKIPSTMAQHRPDLDIFAERVRFDLGQIYDAKEYHRFDVNALIAPSLFSDHTYLGRALGNHQSEHIIEGLLKLGAEPNCDDPIRLWGNTRPELTPLFLRYGSHIDTFYKTQLDKVEYESLVETVPLRYSHWEKLIIGKYLDSKTLEFLLSRIPGRYLERLRPAIQSVFMDELRKKIRFASLGRISVLLRFGADINHRDPRTGRNALGILLENIEYAESRRLEILIDFLLEKGIVINHQDVKGDTPMHLVCMRKPACFGAKILARLLVRGGDASLKNAEGRSVWSLASDSQVLLDVLWDCRTLLE